MEKTDLLQEIKDSLKALKELKIVTVVGKVTVKDAFAPATRMITIADEQESIVSSIDLVQGDITHGMDPAFAPGKDDAVREFHERQVVQGNEIITRNINLLKAIVIDIINILKEDK